MLKLPLGTETLFEYLPHRPPMVWVDRVLEVSDKTGRCEVLLDAAKHYFSDSVLRPSSHIEFMAQSYAFVAIARELLKPTAGLNKLSKAYLVGVTDFSCLSDIPGGECKSLFVDVELTREFKPLILFKGRVVDSQGRVCASAGLKVYSEAE